jgi:hypothetical protein
MIDRIAWAAVLALFVSSRSFAQQLTPVMPEYGPVQGVPEKGITVYRSVPFAAPPVGLLPGDERRKARRGRNEPINAPVSHDPKPLFPVHPNSPAIMRNLTRVVALVSVAFLSSIGALAEKSAEKYTYVIVHGATAGGWEWKQVGKCLTDDGHIVYRPTLTGWVNACISTARKLTFRLTSTRWST